MVSKGRHQYSEINAALKKIKAPLGVQQQKNGHNWGHLVCGVCGQRLAINGTPRNPGTHAKRLMSFARDHAHTEPKE